MSQEVCVNSTAVKIGCDVRRHFAILALEVEELLDDVKNDDDVAVVDTMLDIVSRLKLLACEFEHLNASDRLKFVMNGGT